MDFTYNKIVHESVEALIQGVAEVACVLRMYNEMTGGDHSEECGRIAQDVFNVVHDMSDDEFAAFSLKRLMEDKYEFEGQISPESYIETKEQNTSTD